MAALEAETAPNTRLDLWIAFDYGGRAELVEAARRLVEAGVDPRRRSTRTSFAAHLYAPELPDPDLLIRTSGELRISNFLLWQLAYAELVFVDTLWPDFGARDLREALAEYAQPPPPLRRHDEPASSRALLVAVVGAAARARAGLARRLVAVRARCVAALDRAARVLRDDAAAAARSCSPATRARCSALLGAELGGLEWMLGGVLLTLALAFLLKGIAETRRRRRCRRRDGARRGLDRLGLGFVLLLRDIPEHGRLAVFTVLLAVLAGDTVAYFGGRLLGRHKLAPTISPGKTWEGFVAGTPRRSSSRSSRSTRTAGLPLDRRVARARRS